MAFSEWTVSHNCNGGSAGGSVQSSVALEGSSSLRLRIQTTGGTSGQVLIGKTSGANVITGKVRAVIRHSSTLSTGNNERFGVFCMMQTAIDVANQAYFWLTDNVGTNTPNVNLFKGTAVSLGSSLGSASVGQSIGNDINVGLELKWLYDTTANQLFLFGSKSQNTVSTVTAYAFNDLVQGVAYTDVSPFTTGVSAGIVTISQASTTDTSIVSDRAQIWVP